MLVLSTGVATAHQINQSRFTSPIPLVALYVGAGLTVALTAGISAVVIDTDRTARGFTRRLVRSQSTGVRIRSVVRIGALVLFGGLLLAGLFGKQVQAENLATLVVWPLWFDGLALMAAMVGSPWRVLSPWRTLYEGLCRLEGETIAVIGDYPPSWELWPAALGFVLLVGIIENLTVVPRSPRVTALLITLYAFVMILGGITFGRSWFEHADPIEVFLGLFQRVAPLRIRRAQDGSYDLVGNPPGRGCLKPIAGASGVVFVIATVYTISFDGFTSTPEFQDLLFASIDRLGFSTGQTSIVLYVLGLVGFVVAFALVIRTVALIGSTVDWRTGLRAFAPTVLPIAVGYEFAHYTPYIIQNAAEAIHVTIGFLVASPPEFAPLAWLSLSVYWGFEVVAIVIGHIIAVLATHRVAVDRFESPKVAWRAHIPLVLLMVGYTMISLWIISRPVVT